MQADTVLTNGVIYTQEGARSRVTALAIRAGRVLASGADEEMRALLRVGGQLLNLDGRAVFPGLIDAHVHLQLYADFLESVDLNATQSEQDAAERVAARARTLPPGSWVQGSGWDQTRWPGGAFPSAASLDALIPDHPVFLLARSAHAAWVNSAALREAYISETTPDPLGGSFARDERGRPSGLLLESAMEQISKVIPPADDEQNAARILRAIRRGQRAGLVAVHDFDGAACFRALQLLRERGQLQFRVVKTIRARYLDQALALGLRGGFGDDWLRIGAVKLFADGALGPRTAWMIDPYEGEPENRGISVTDPEDIYLVASRASAGGLPTTVHAIGDRAVHEVLNVFEAVRREEAVAGIRPDQRRHRIEHVQLIHPDDVGRLGRLGLVASMQPTHATSDMVMADQYWGDRSAYAYNWRLQLRAGAILAFGSDAPIEAIEPLPGIQAAVTRRRLDGTPGPEGWRSASEERFSVMEAVAGFTTGAAWAAGLEDRQGRLAPGHYADLIVLGQDITVCDPMSIAETPVLGTMIDGEWVHREF